MDTFDALKKLAVALGCASSIAKVEGTTTSEVIEFIAKNLPATYKGKK